MKAVAVRCRSFQMQASHVPTHNQGRKHQRLLLKKKRKNENQQCSIFVKGFDKNSDVASDLQRTFSPYGTVKDVYVDKNKSAFAIVEFDTSEAVKLALNEKDIISLDGRRLTVKPRTVKDKTERNPFNSSVVVERLSVQKSQAKSSEDNAECTSAIFQQLVNYISETKQLSYQMDQVTEVLELSSEDIKLRHLIVDLLSEVFNEVFSDAEVEPFGSTVNQFGTKYSDLDLCLVTNELAPYPNQYTCPAESNVANDDESLPEPTKLVPDEICDKSNGDEDDVESTVKNISSMEESMATVAEILKRFVPGCKHVLSVQSAHCPVIKFTHVDSGLNCDLSINNRLALRNSELLKYYALADHRVRPLIYVVRTWAKLRGLAGTGGCQVTQYALTVMTIHFLQQVEPPVLRNLQDNTNHSSHDGSPDEERVYIYGWNCFFDKRRSTDTKSENCSDQGDLLLDFFKYFARFDFSRMVVLVNKPEIVRQEDFIDKLKKLKIEKNFKQSALWIQDPFELSHNIAQNVTDSGVKVLKEEFERAKKIAGNLSRHSMSMMKDDESSANLSNSCGSHAFSEGKLPSGTEVDKIDSTISGCAGNDPISINRRNRLIYSLIDLFSVKQSIQDTQWKKRRKAKYVFDIYGSRASSAEKNCYDCSRIAMDILESDLGMQCQVTYRNKDGGSVFEPSKSRKGDLCEETGELINDCSNQISVRSEGADSGECSLGMSQPGVFEDTNEPPRKKIRNETLFSAENFNKLDTVLIKATAWQNTWAKRKCEREFLTPLTDRACWKSESTVTPVSSSSKPESEEVSAESSLSPSNFVSRVDCELRCQSSFKKISHTGTEAEAQSLPRVRDWFPPAQTVSDIPKKSPCMSSDKFSSAGQHSKLSVSLHTLSKRPSEAILVITVRISKSEEQNDEPRCRIVVELEETTNLKFFHTFFAFFKKQILSAFRGHGT